MLGHEPPRLLPASLTAPSTPVAPGPPSAVGGIASLPTSLGGQEAPGPTHTLPPQQVQPEEQGDGQSFSDKRPAHAKSVIKRANGRPLTRLFMIEDRATEGAAFIIPRVHVVAAETRVSGTWTCASVRPQLGNPPMRTPRTLIAPALLTLAAACGSSVPPATPPTQAAAAPDPATDAKLRASLAGGQRTDQEKARDVYRHPLETLEFFGLRDDMTVVEISPGGGWYSAVLAPVLRDKGKLIVAGGDPNGDPKSEGTKNAQELQARFQQMPQSFDRVQSVVIKRDGDGSFGPAESADMVLTFRNFHNWVGSPYMDGILKASFAVLKHGGVLGLTDHRAKAGAPMDPKTVDDTGYVPEDYVIQTVEHAGFKLAGKSEVNANPKDTKDYPKGVWTLPPTYELGDVDHPKYQAIGESDRMTLKFVKP